MKDKDIDTHLTQFLPGEPPREAFKQQILHDSTAEFVRVQRRRSAWRRAELAAAAVLVAGVAFLGGRLSAPPTSPMNVAVAPPSAAKPDDVSVPSDLVAWLEAARLFKQLGMEDRMARAVERAGRLVPYETGIVSGVTEQVFAAGRPVWNHKKRVEPMGISGPNPSAENINQLLAQSFGD